MLSIGTGWNYDRDKLMLKRLRPYFRFPLIAQHLSRSWNRLAKCTDDSNTSKEVFWKGSCKDLRRLWFVAVIALVVYNFWTRTRSSGVSVKAADSAQFSPKL